MNEDILQPIRQWLEKSRPMSDELKALLKQEFEIIELPRHEILLKEGQVSNYLYITLKGLLRFYYLKDGEEVCSLFVNEPGICTSISGFFTRRPGTEYIETLEPCIIARIGYERLQQLYNENAELNFVARVITEQFLVRSEERLLLLRKNSAEDRYVTFTEQHPEFLQRVPLKYIATYLGTTLETISRIRAKLSKRPV